MQSSNQMNGGTKSSHWLDTVETFAVVSTIGGTVAAAVSQQVAMVTIPMSLTAAINLANRRRQMGEMLAQQRLEVSHLIQQNTDSMRNELTEAQQENERFQLKLDERHEEDTQTSEGLEGLNSRSAQLDEKITTLHQQQNESQSSLAELSEQQQSTAAQGDELSSQLGNLQHDLSLLQSTTFDLCNLVETQHNSSQLLAAQAESVEALVENLRQIEAINQQLSSQPNVAESFYQRGLIRKRLQRTNDQQMAINDFSQAIQLEPTHAGAYFERGLLQAECGQKQQAVDDLHAAAKLFFEASQLDQYEKARQVSLNLHELVNEATSIEESDDPMLVENLFS